MKKITLLLALFVLINIMSVNAQEISEEKKSEFYYVTVPIEKVYLHSKGYVILYRKTPIELGRVYIPVEWFTDPTGQGDLIALGSGRTWPHLTVYYKNGEFSHLKLFVRRSKTHETWGVVPLGTNLDAEFSDAGNIQLF